MAERKRSQAILPCFFAIAAVISGCGLAPSDESTRSEGLRAWPSIEPPTMPERRDIEEPPVEVRFPFLDDEDPKASVSVGTTSHGRLVSGHAIEESDTLAILPKQRARGLNYGTDEMVALLAQAGEALHAATKTKLWLGNVSAKGGGDISYSVSHNVGRDADIAFPYLDRAGRRVDPPDLVPLDKRLRSDDGALSLDVERTWLIVRALLLAKEASVEWIFVSEPIRKKLLEHARARGDARLVERASAVLRQPAGAAPHNDHLHVRLMCSEQDRGGGCVDEAGRGGASHAFVEGRTARATLLLAAPSASVRGAAALRLAVLGAKDRVPRIVALLDDPDAEVRFAAATAIGVIGTKLDVKPLARRLARETEVVVARRIVEAASRLGGPDGVALVTTLLAPPLMSMEPCTGTPETRVPYLDVLEPPKVAGPRSLPWAIHCAALDRAKWVDDLAPVDLLVALLGSGDEVARARAAEALAFTTGYAFIGSIPFDADSGKIAAEKYRSLLPTWRRSGRDAALVGALSRGGYKVRELGGRDAWELVRASAGPPELSYAAQTLLTRLFADELPTLSFALGEACRERHMTVLARRSTLRLGLAPKEVMQACRTVKGALFDRWRTP